MGKIVKPTDRLSQAALALAHPVRRTILTAIAKGVDTPGGIAKDSGHPLGVVSYHCRMLRDYGIIEVTDTQPVRGALQHYYGYTPTAEVEFDLLGAMATGASLTIGEALAADAETVAA